MSKRRDKRKESRGELSDELALDPRVRDLAVFNRLKLMLETEAIHQAWGCALWRLERLRLIEPDHRRAGDEYERVVVAGRKALGWDISMFPPEVHDQMEKTCQHKRKRWEEARQLLRAGKDGIKIQIAVDDLCLDDIYPATEVEKKRVFIGLERLAHFFGFKDKKAA